MKGSPHGFHTEGAARSSLSRRTKNVPDGPVVLYTYPAEVNLGHETRIATRYNWCTTRDEGLPEGSVVIDRWLYVQC